MDAASNPEYLQATANAVADFRDSLNEFLELYVVNEWLARGIAPSVLPKDGADPAELRTLRATVSPSGRPSCRWSFLDGGIHHGSWCRTR